MDSRSAAALARQHYRLGRLNEAEALYRQILTREPRQADALAGLGMIESRRGRHAEAADLIRQAIAVDPTEAEFPHNLGMVLSRRNQLEAAAAAFERAVQLRPEYVEAWNNLGTVRKSLGKFDEAVAALERAVALNPNFPEAWYNLANSLRELDRFDPAVDAYRRALALRPQFPQAWSNLAVVWKEVGCLKEAIDAHRRALDEAPDPVVASNLLCTLQYDADTDPARALTEHRRWNERYAKAVTAPKRRIDPEVLSRRIRIGYVSPDLRTHPVGRCLLPIWNAHRRERFEIFCYSDTQRPDDMTAALSAQAEHWHETANLSHERLADLVRGHGIDVLVDLAVHTDGNRLLAFARRPAPVQVTWLGWPGTTGMDAMDWRLSDPYLDPPQIAGVEQPFVEKTRRLPHCFWCCDPRLESEPPPEVNELPAIRNGFITFGCFNNFAKITDRTLDLWVGVLAATADSRLALRAPRGRCRGRVVDRLAAGGIDADRVEFIDRQSRRDYWKQYRRIDITLDTFPYNGHTTMIDSLWMGVPAVSAIGPLPVGRAGWSILSNVGLAELAVPPAEFVAAAETLARDVSRLSQLRSELRGRLIASPITDGSRFRRDLEDAFLGILRAEIDG